jgi:hypothetical protein
MTGTTRFAAAAAAVATAADLTRRGAVAALVVALLVAYAATRLRAAASVLDDARHLFPEHASVAAAASARRDVPAWLSAPAVADALVAAH